MTGMTIKQSERFRYHRICQAYNTVSRDPTSGDFILASLALHAAKGWRHIPKYMAAPCYIRRCGELEATP